MFLRTRHLSMLKDTHFSPVSLPWFLACKYRASHTQTPAELGYSWSIHICCLLLLLPGMLCSPSLLEGHRPPLLGGALPLPTMHAAEGFRSKYSPGSSEPNTGPGSSQNPSDQQLADKSSHLLGQGPNGLLPLGEVKCQLHLHYVFGVEQG